MKFTRRSAVIAAVLAGVMAAGTACSSDEPENKDGNNTAAEVKLTVDSFGTVGFGDLLKQYEASHPGVKIELRNEKEHEKVYVPKLLQYLETNSGAGDVVMIEEGIIPRFRSQPDKWVDLNQHGAAAIKDNFIPWKWTLGSSADGAKQIALGTDVGGLAMCYRSDLFAEAGLGKTREEVGKNWPDWDSFINTGKTFQSKNKKTKFVDGPTSLFNARLAQEAPANSNFTYFDATDAYIADKNPGVKAAFDFAAKLHSEDLTAKLKTFDKPWEGAFKRDAFATMVCPSWMLGVIKEKAGDSYAGKWDVASIPGGGGNWGGSFLAVPAQSKHQKEAVELLKFLTTPEALVAQFKTAGGLPSSPQALENADVKNSVNDYFNNAPVGQIFAAGALGLKPVSIGSKNNEVRTVFEDLLLAVDQGKVTPAEAWTKALEDGREKAE